MTRVLNSFKVRAGNKILDYRLGEKLNLNQVKLFFQKNYQVKKLWNGSRHVLGILTRNNVDYFLKLSTSEGISIFTKNEHKWNDYFNEYTKVNNYLVPKNHGRGYFQKKYFYLITDYFDGKLICEINGDVNNLVVHIDDIILLSELIQKMPVVESDYRMRFINKVNSWFNDIPSSICKRYKVKTLLDIAEKGVDGLSSKPRHGDFTPWHIIKLFDHRLGLIDGEHFLPDGVENYDICFFIQRVFSVLKNPIVARNIYSQLLIKGYKKNKLKTVLAARAIGGFLDESLIEKSEYNFASRFKDWVMQLD
ncbi:MAG: hypothetical protein PHV63_00400 [Candidatus Daviesbacteria bacterium]|nr:hypothetical protein [Candidatus Daviesbacteria bacterium]